MIRFFVFGMGLLSLGCAGQRPPDTLPSQLPTSAPDEALEQELPSRAASTASASATAPQDAPSSQDRYAVAQLRSALTLYGTFIAKAGTAPEFEDAVARTRERMEDIERTIAWLEEGLRERAH